MLKRWIHKLLLWGASHPELLRLIPMGAILDHVADWLAEQMRRPNSVESQAVINGVARLEETCTRFLDRVQVR